MYVKYISQTQIEYPPTNKDGIINYNLDEERMLADGYKPLVEAEKPSDNDYTLFYQETENAVNEVVIVPTPAEKLQKAKDKKHQEKTEKCKTTRENMVFDIEIQEKYCVFDTSSQTQSDLQAAAIVTSTGATYPNWVTNNYVVLELTAADIRLIFEKFFSLVSPLYTKELQYTQQIDAAQTIQEVEAIEINYLAEVE